MGLFHVRDMLRLALHLGVRACKPGPDPVDPIDQVTAEIDRIKMQARSTVSLCFSLLSEIHSSRREMMWKIQGAKASELRGRSIFEPEDRDIMARIVEKREWESKLLPKLAKTDQGRGRGGRKGGRGRGGGGRRRQQRGSSGADDSGASLPPRTVNRLLQLPQLPQPRQPQLRPSRPSLLAAPRRVAAGVEGDARNDPHCADACR